MHIKRILLAVCFLSLAAVLPALALDEKKLKADADEAIAMFKKNDSTLADRFKTAAGYAVFPSSARAASLSAARTATACSTKTARRPGMPR